MVVEGLEEESVHLAYFNMAGALSHEDCPTSQPYLDQCVSLFNSIYKIANVIKKGGAMVFITYSPDTFVTLWRKCPMPWLLHEHLCLGCCMNTFAFLHLSCACGRVQHILL